MNTAIEHSESVIIGPRDRRCKYWAKIIRAEHELPLPANVQGAIDISEPFLKHGDEEIFQGDFLIEGEENHYRRNEGWSYLISYIDSVGEFVRLIPTSEHKKIMKEGGLDKDFLMGSGQLAAAIRVAHGVRSKLI